MNPASKFAKSVKLKEVELLLLEDPLAVLSCFSLVSSEEMEAVGSSVAHIYFVHRRSADLLKLCATQEIISTARPEELFRQDSIRIVVLQDFLRRRGQRWLYKTLRKPLRKIIQSDVPVEIDKMRLSTNEDVSINLKNLEDAVKSVLNPIFSNPESIPQEIGGLCKLLFHHTNERFCGEGYTALSGSFFLRFICPYIGSPKFWHCLTKAEIKPDIRRKLVLIAKVVQGVANENSEFNEAYMNVLEPFVKSNVKKLHFFYDQLTEISPNIQNTSWRITKEMKVSLSESLNNVYHFFLANYQRIFSEVITPLLPVYSGADLFKQRMELLFWEDIPQHTRSMHSSARVIFRREVNERLRTLREGKTHGEQIWGILFAGLRHVIGENVILGNNIEAQGPGCLFSTPGFLTQKRNISLSSFDARNALGQSFRGDSWKSHPHERFPHHFEVDPDWNSLSEASSVKYGEDSMADVTEFTTDNFSDEETELENEVKEEDPTFDHPIYIWLQMLGYEEYFELFVERNICSLESLHKCTERDLLEFGVKQPQVRARMIGSFHQHASGSREWNKVNLSGSASKRSSRKKKGKRKSMLADWTPRSRGRKPTVTIYDGLDSTPLTGNFEKLFLSEKAERPMSHSSMVLTPPSTSSQSFV